MTTKIYGIYGRTTAMLRIPTGRGKAFVEVTFDRGIPNGGPNYRPATFSTSDPVMQSILESSSLFGSLFTIVRIVRNDGGTTAAKKETEQKKDIESLEGILTKEDAVAYLKSRGAKATQLRSNEAIISYAESIGVAFPNLTL